MLKANCSQSSPTLETTQTPTSGGWTNVRVEDTRSGDGYETRQMRAVGTRGGYTQ